MNVEILTTYGTELDATITVSVDGAVLCAGDIGGEPEDNNIWRDYDWIVPMLVALSKALSFQRGQAS